nr:MAG TPA: hypothetical protein [Caudoviricetes sp.]
MALRLSFAPAGDGVPPSFQAHVSKACILPYPQAKNKLSGKVSVSKTVGCKILGALFFASIRKRLYSYPQPIQRMVTLNK